MSDPFPAAHPWTTLENLRNEGGGSIVNGTVDVDNVAKSLGVSKIHVRNVIEQFADTGRSKVFAAITGRSGADTTRHAGVRGALIAAYGPGKRGGAVDVKAAAKGEGVHSSTVYRWLNGKSTPNTDNLAHLAGTARRAVTTKAGRRRAVQARRSTSEGKHALNYGARLRVTGYQGVEGYERDRTVYWDLDPDQVDAMWNSYVDGGEAGLLDWMRGYAAGDDYGNTEDWNVFHFDDIGFPDSGST
ncbi:helix-turn-helix domain-containing protein [Aldersonia sp. NBC_00410]|uniref:helix-turn-helix domain-containing protein n=1 Tax=Aldersonia sp. NBC_00410 TaxID=2975954 RepID=UPI00224FC808|nr:helix-turn-helix transcriptional regulator [Aldersonia sp. NBC_00410]MCX5046251.1 helix-turn-helix domain-containing protein [Aldersonia sp. NBC_00410]